jgi:hypothetical protein
MADAMQTQTIAAHCAVEGSTVAPPDTEHHEQELYAFVNLLYDVFQTLSVEERTRFQKSRLVN